MLNSLAGLTESLLRLPEQLDKSAAKGAMEAALLLKAAVGAAEGRHAGKPIAQVKIIPLAGAQVEVKMASRKAHLLDHDTKPHDVAVKRRAALFMPGSFVNAKGHGQNFAVSAHVPGTKGNLAWERAVAAATPKMLEAVAATVPAAIIESFSA